jgi:hypothetical protein
MAIETRQFLRAQRVECFCGPQAARSVLRDEADRGKLARSGGEEGAFVARRENSGMDWP